MGARNYLYYKQEVMKDRKDLLNEIKAIIIDSKENNFKLDWAMIAAFKIYKEYISKTKL